MVTPHAVVGDVDALFAFARSFHQRAIEIDPRLGKELGRLPGPSFLANLIKDVQENMNVLGLEAAAKIARGGWIGNALGAQGIEKYFIIAAEFDVLQTRTITQGIVSQIEDVIRFVIGHMDL